MAKSRVSCRNVVLYKCLAKCLGIQTVVIAAGVLAKRTALEDAGLCLIATDSVCSSLTFKPGLKLKNTLVRNAVKNCIRGAQEIMQFFPLCNIHFIWIKGTENTADLLTKMFPNPIQLSNGDRWIHGSDVMKTQQSNTAHTFLKIDCEKGVQYFGLPEEITKIEQNKAKLMRVRGAERFDEREKEVKCLRCGMEEDFYGILLTRAQSKE